jgi:peptidyl-tRNA hydrolase
MAEEKNSYRPSKGEENPWVMYLIVRHSLNMGTGKTAAQVGHAVDMICKQQRKLAVKNVTQALVGEELLQFYAFEEWDEHANRKVVLKADDQQFEKVKKELPLVYVVRDAGLTEIAAGSETVIGLWPNQKESFPKIIHRLQVLK